MHHRSPTIGFPAETGADERRTLLTPHLARALIDAGFRIVTEPGIGAGIGQDDAALHGVEFRPSPQAWDAPLILRYKSGLATEVARLQRGQAIGAIFHAEGDPGMLATLTATGVQAYSYEFLHEGGYFPLAMAGGRIAGTLAVQIGAQALRRSGGRGVLLDHLPGSPQAHVVVIGSGNVGAASVRTATCLGARVTVLARTADGAATYAQCAPYGAHVEVNTPERLAAVLPTADLVVGAILISTHTTPAMITRDHLATMRPGAVIVDATCGYGEGYLPTAGPLQRFDDPPHEVEGVLHVKLDALPKQVPVTASHTFAHAAAPYLVRLARRTLLGANDPAVDSAQIASAGRLVHPVVREHADLYAAKEVT